MSIGFGHFEDLFGRRDRALTVLSGDGGEAKVVVLDSSKPDLDGGEVGREFYGWIDSELRGWDGDRRSRWSAIRYPLSPAPGGI